MTEKHEQESIHTGKQGLVGNKVQGRRRKGTAQRSEIHTTGLLLTDCSDQLHTMKKSIN